VTEGSEKKDYCGHNNRSHEKQVVLMFSHKDLCAFLKKKTSRNGWSQGNPKGKLWTNKSCKVITYCAD
jgi:hypothetical protein